MKYRVEAQSEAEATRKVLNGTALPVDNGQEYIEVLEDRGLAVDEHRELAEALRDLGIQVDEVIPSIRSVEQI